MALSFRRSEMRWACTPTGVHAHLDGYDRPIGGQVVEVSREGMQLHVEEPIAVGSLVTIEMGNVIVLGDVRHCNSRQNYYTVGLRTRDVRSQRAC